MSEKFSLVIATLGRKETLAVLLESLCCQTYQADLIEIIVVDQNMDGLIDELVHEYTHRLNICHVKSSVLGLSVNRNIGVQRSTGSIVAFPDDDCVYPSDVLDTVIRLFAEHKTDFIIGRIWDEAKECDAIRKWPKSVRAINKLNFYRLTSSITLFSRCTQQQFDERFGLGAPYGSNEDTSYVYSLLSSGKTGIYSPLLKILHADQPISFLSPEKVAGYAFGFGRFVREYLSIYTFAIFVLSALFQVVGGLKSLLVLNFAAVSLRINSLKWRLTGLIRKR